MNALLYLGIALFVGVTLSILYEVRSARSDRKAAGLRSANRGRGK